MMMLAHHGIFYKPRGEKVMHAIAIVAGQLGGVARRDLEWIFYRAEREHLNDYGRPVMGLHYRNIGGLPDCREVGDLLECSEAGVPFRFIDGHVIQRPDADLEMDCFSKSDITALTDAVNDFKALMKPPSPADMPIGWDGDSSGDWISYEFMLEDGPLRAERLDDLACIAAHICF